MTKTTRNRNITHASVMTAFQGIPRDRRYLTVSSCCSGPIVPSTAARRCSKVGRALKRGHVKERAKGRRGSGTGSRERGDGKTYLEFLEKILEGRNGAILSRDQNSLIRPSYVTTRWATNRYQKEGDTRRGGGGEVDVIRQPRATTLRMKSRLETLTAA